MKSRPENSVRLILIKLGFINSINSFFICNYKAKNYELDFADPINKIAIEVNGTYWHRHFTSKKTSQNKFRKIYDILKYKRLSESGWKIIVLWEHTIKRNPQKILEYLRVQILRNIEI